MGDDDASVVGGSDATIGSSSSNPEAVVGETNQNQKDPYVSMKESLKEEMEYEKSDLRKTLNANGFFYPEDMQFNDKFYRFPRNDPYNYVSGAREYLFFTKPDLPLIHDANSTEAGNFLTNSAYGINYFADLADSPGYRKSVFRNLCLSGVKQADPCPFMRILSNRKTSNMDVPDIQVEELETAVNMYGTKILYPKSSGSGDEGVDFSVEFEDTRFLEIYHLFKVWDYYRQLKWYGILSPASYIQEYGENRKETNPEKPLYQRALAGVKRDVIGNDAQYNSPYGAYTDYIFYKVLHDHIRVFKFLVDIDDGETILYAASAIGCYPKTIQRSSFSEVADKGPLKISVGFKVSGWFEDDISSTCRDFNIVIGSWIERNWDEGKVKEYTDGYVDDLYDDAIGSVSQKLVDVPFIYRAPLATVQKPRDQIGRLGDFHRYQLKWIDKDKIKK